MTTRRVLRPLVLCAAVLLLAGACSSSDDNSASDGDTTTSVAAETTTTAPVEPATLDVTSSDYAYALGADSVPAGLVTVNQTNEGDENHQVTLIRLEDGQTAPDLAAGLAGPEGDHFATNESYAGGPNGIPAGGSNSATVELTEGTYALICFIPAADGESHFKKGMVGQLDVTAAEGPAAEPPATTETVAMSDFTYDVPAGFTGQGTVAITNDGPQVHELTITNADGSVAGGLAGIAPGATGYVNLALDPGDYSFVCFVSDEATGTAHVALGMSTDVSIGSG